MRKIIYKAEFEYLCHVLDIRDESKIELLGIFQNTPYDVKEYYELRREYINYNLIKEKISTLCDGKDNDTIIKQIFTIGSDLDYIPDELLQEIKLKKVAVFVGAGMSKLISNSYPLWGELADHAIDFLKEKGKINFFEKERLKREIPDPKQKLSIFEKYLEEGGIRGKDSPEFEEFIKKQLGHKDPDPEGKKFPNPYQLLCSDTFGFIKVTSNLDLEFADALKDTLERSNVSLDPVGKEPQSSSIVQHDILNYIAGPNTEEGFSQNKVYMIHGHISEPGKVVLTTEDYINEYYSDKGTIREFLSSLFDKYTVLFISYGLAEFPILERIFSPREEKEIKRPIKKRHFILLPTFSTEISYFKVQSTYFDKLGITAIPYYLDTEGYHRLCCVFKNWRKLIEREPIKNLEVIELFLKNGEGIKDVIKIIKQDPHSLNYMFLNLKDIEHWDKLKMEGLFVPDKFFGAESSAKNYDFLYTPAAYFEKISEALKAGTIDPVKYSKELMDVIEQVSSYAREEQKELSLRTRYFFIDVIANIPCEYVSLDFIEGHLPSWVNNEQSLEYLEHPLYTRLLRSLINSNRPEDWLKAEKIFEILINETYKSKDISKHYLSDAFSDGSVHTNLYKTIAQKFSDQFLCFLIRKIEDFLIKKYPYTVSYVIDDEENVIRLKYLGDKIFEEKLENGNGFRISFDPKGTGKEFALAVVKEEAKGEVKNITNLTENFSKYGKQYCHEFYGDDNDYSIFNEEESYSYRQKSLVKILKQVLKEWSFIDENFVRTLLHSFLDQRHEFFIQLSLFLIDANWRFSDFIESIFERTPEIVLEEQIIKNDLREFLKRNISKLSDNQKEKLNERIDRGPYYYRDNHDENSKRIWKLGWYHILKNDSFFKIKFEKLSAGKGYSSEDLDDSGRLTWHHEFSPKSVEDLNKMEVPDITEYIQAFVPDSETKWNRGSIRQLANSIALLHKTNPSKIYQLIETYLALPYVYADPIINAFENNWKNKETRHCVDLERSFRFIENYLEHVVLENEGLITPSEPYIDSKIVTGSIADFISSGNNSKENEFPEIYLERCKKIILTLTKSIINYADVDRDIKDSGSREYTLNHSLNSNQGKILHAHFYVSRRYASNKEKENKEIDNDFKQSLLKCFELGIRDSFIVFGSFITSYAYFDEEFALKQIDDFINLDDENWKSFMGGWLFWDFRGYSPQLHKRLNPHYFKAIEKGFDVKGIQESSGLTRKIVIAYYWGYEDVNGELIDAFLKRSPIDQLERLVRILQYDHKELKKNEEMFMRVVPLWDKINESLRLRTENEKFKVISETLSLSRYVDKLDKDAFDRFLFVFKSDCERVFVRNFLKELQEFLRKENILQTAQYICSLIELIVNKHYPHPDDNLKNLLTDLFEMKRPEVNGQLRSICNRIIEVNEGYISWPLDLVRIYIPINEGERT